MLSVPVDCNVVNYPNVNWSADYKMLNVLFLMLLVSFVVVAMFGPGAVTSIHIRLGHLPNRTLN
jgi:hypothetical protein